MSEASPRTPMIWIGSLWVIIIVIFLVWYFSSSMPQYLDGYPAVTDATSTPSEVTVAGPMTVTSTAFGEGERMPARFTCTESQDSPPLTIRDVPEGAKSLAIIMEDRDIPERFNTGGTFLHWVAYDIDPSVRDIETDEQPGTQGVSGLGTPGYMGPCPPRDFEPTEHRYYFTVYALDTLLNAPKGLDKKGLMSLMEGHIIAQAEFMGRYEQPEK